MAINREQDRLLMPLVPERRQDGERVAMALTIVGLGGMLPGMLTRPTLILLLIAWMGGSQAQAQVQVQTQVSAPGDFDASGRVDLDDLALLRQAMGGDDSLYDLDQSGRVGMQDLFRFAELVEVLLPLPTPERFDYSARTTREAFTLSTQQYNVQINHATPFGISSLRLSEQGPDFANKSLPLADWEWLWYRAPALRHHKLLEMDWGQPEVEQFQERVEVTYRQPLSRNGIVAEVRYTFHAREPSFHVVYSILNGSPRKMTDVYVMLGLPGFSNHAYVTSVETARQKRLPRWPSQAFEAEAFVQNIPEYLLLRHDVAAGISQGLKGSVTMESEDQAYRLSSYFLSDAGIRSVYSAHTNKPRYLTSHLYATLGEIPPLKSRSVTIHHALTRLRNTP
jgi:hypothetical protein